MFKKITQKEFDKMFPGFKDNMIMEEAIASSQLAGKINYDSNRKRRKSADGGTVKGKAGKYGKGASCKTSDSKRVAAHKTAQFIGAKKGAKAKYRKGAQGLDGNAKRKAIRKVAIKKRKIKIGATKKY
jgi:hypothetical protein